MNRRPRPPPARREIRPATKPRPPPPAKTAPSPQQGQLSHSERGFHQKPGFSEKPGFWRLLGTIVTRSADATAGHPVQRAMDRLAAGGIGTESERVGLSRPGAGLRR